MADSRSPSPSASAAASATGFTTDVTPGLADRQGAWAPLGNRVFRALWIATVASNVGTWVNDTASAWMMTEMASSPLLVSLVQVATTLPICLLAIPAGVLADIVDRRRLLIAAQSWMALSALALAALAALELLNPVHLLMLTFCLGIGAALTMPAWSATVPELVGPGELAAAVALGSLGMNIARAVGPALGGFVVAGIGSAWAYVLNALSFCGVIATLVLWRQTVVTSELPPENFSAAMRAGWRYVREAPAVQAVLVRCVAFFAFASATWALLPVVARHDLHGNATLYGALLGAVGIGAIAGALVLPRARRRMSANTLVAAASLLYAAMTAIIGLATSLWLIIPCMLLTGAAWLAMMSSFQIAAQTAVPAWVRARTLALNIVAFSGSMAAGSAVWGAVASAFGSSVALGLAALGAAASLLLGRRFPLHEGNVEGQATSAHWPEPVVVAEVDHDRGPVLVTIEYEVDAETVTAFLAAITRLGHVRRRDGASRWGIFEDAARPGTWVEAFIVPSWLDHLRQHARVTQADRVVEQAVRHHHRGPDLPRVRHLLAPAALSQR
ncbi:MAG: MFS transporter [Rhodospirillales bacterium]|nr:MFS transporter [Rhodospirillales bacterium]